jgi:hypothetical protein
MTCYCILVGLFCLINLSGLCLYIWLSKKADAVQGYRGIVKGKDMDGHGKITTKL